MPENNLTFAKIVASLSSNSWSQAYNAGKLFSVLSLEKLREQNLEPVEISESLQILGKKILDKLEQEFFTLEVKNFDSIKQAVSISFAQIPNDTLLSFAVGVFIDNILYLFSSGGGKIFLKRGSEFGTILESNSEGEITIKSASGFLVADDLIILSTKSFCAIVTKEDLTSSLDNLPPNEISEILAPRVHEKEDGGASAIIIRYKKEEIQTDIQETNKTLDLNPHLNFIKSRLSNIQSKIQTSSLKINHSKKIFSTIAVIILIVLISSIFFAIKKQNDAKVKILFANIYPGAQKKYDEGQSLLNLNKNLARDSFTQALTILEDGKSKFSKNSKEEFQIIDLIKKVQDSLIVASAVNAVTPQEVAQNNSDLLSLEISNKTAKYFTKDDKNIYFVDLQGIYSIDKIKKEKITITKNDNNWKDIGGIGVYFGNIYVLDKSGKILKFVAGDNGFTKTDYFASGISPDLSGAVSIAIDGSIWILQKDATITKFTKGKSDSLTISGLDKPFSNPSRIATEVNFKNVYILDNGNNRIVVIDKNGAYLAQYQAEILKEAKDFEVLESSKKILVLSGGKIFQIDIK